MRDIEACGDPAPCSRWAFYEGRIILKPVTLEDCKRSCENLLNCKGIEYKESDSKCELWNVRPLYAKPAASHKCFSFDRVLTDMHGWSNLVDDESAAGGHRAVYNVSSPQLAIVGMWMLSSREVNCSLRFPDFQDSFAL